MAWTGPTVRATGDLITSSIWNTDLVNNLAFLHDSLISLNGAFVANAQISVITDTPTLGATSTTLAFGPLGTFATAAYAVLGATAGWYSDSGHTTTVSQGGAWCRYYASGTGIFADYRNPTGATIYPLATVGCLGY